MLGPRIGRWDSDKEPPMGSATNAIIGMMMLWWAWIAFNQVTPASTEHCTAREGRLCHF